MKILRRKSDNVVLYAQDDIELGEILLGDGWRNNDLNTTNSEILEADSVPEYWTGGAMAYINGVWVIYDESIFIDLGITIEYRIASDRLRIQTQNKSDCKAFILSNYSEETQRNASLGLYTPEVVTAMADHIAAIIAVENTTWDLIEASDDPESVPKPVWPEA